MTFPTVKLSANAGHFPERRASVVRHLPALLVLTAFSAILVPSVRQGLGSLDGFLILRAARTLAAQHQLVLSRPPGHPLSDWGLFGGMAVFVRWFAHRSFSTTMFLTAQLACAAVAAGLFYLLLVRLRVGLFAATAALIAFIASPVFLDQVCCGEEFIPGLCFALAGLLLLPPAAPRPTELTCAASAVLWACAAGCRPEYLGIGVVAYPTLCGLGLLDRRTMTRSLVVLAVCAIVVWLPVFAVAGITLPYGHGMGWRWVVASFGYRVLFDAFGLPLSLVIWSGVAVALRRLVKRGQFERDDSVALLALVLALVFAALLLFHPDKSAYLLITLPFTLLLLTRAGAAMTGVAALLAVVGWVATVDVVREWQLVRPFVGEGAYARTMHKKSAAAHDYLVEVAASRVPPRSLFVVNLWSWDFEYQSAQRTAPRLRPAPDVGPDGAAWKTDDAHVFLARDVVYTLDELGQYADAGFEIVMDWGVWRESFARREPPPRSNRVMIGSTPVRLIAVSARR